MSISADSARTGSWAICDVEDDRVAGHHWFLPAPTIPTDATRIRQVDVDAFVLAHRPTWDRLEALVKRRRRLTGAEVDELVDLYQRVSTHLSMVRTASSRFGAGGPVVDAGGAGPLGGDRCACTAVERVRPVLDGVVPGGRLPGLAVVARHGGGVLRRRGGASRCWVAGNPEVQATIGTPERDRAVGQPRLRRTTTARTRPASFALQVWVNNSWVAAQCIGFAVLLGMPIPVCAVPERRQSRGHPAA